ncbi:SDR family NAD(P)-dependent oxidoreductase [Thalassotalea sp. G2M2-11]|uniref:SDR family NAD(P)-dependent oxidoreductase n=1 Tax=Thalassotalea sp. G2M2-11 TaxID=2787627 RepID=UPI001F499924|nr:SDR family NAD(P)-dependent oxidoreductase [Thalassotalea sp. G2M2-11]
MSTKHAVNQLSQPKKVMITGATSGIGLALTHYYAQAGYQLIACGRNKEQLAQLAEQYAHCQTLAFDVTDEVALADAAEQVSDIDILILNAGDCRYLDDAKYFDSQLFKQVVTVNLLSLSTLLEYFLPKVNRQGQLVFISSSATLLPFPRAEAYGSSKAGVDYLANTLRLSLKPHDISVTLVHPGFVKTPLTDKNDFNMPFMISSDHAAQRIAKGVALKKPYLHFPKRLTLLLKIIALLPQPLWQKFALKDVKL